MPDSETAYTRGQNEFHDLTFTAFLPKIHLRIKEISAILKKGPFFKWCQGSSYLPVEPLKLSMKCPTQLLTKQGHKRAIITSTLKIHLITPSQPQKINPPVYPLSLFIIKTIIIHMNKVNYTGNQHSVHSFIDNFPKS